MTKCKVCGKPIKKYDPKEAEYMGSNEKWIHILTDEEIAEIYEGQEAGLYYHSATPKHFWNF